MLLTITGFTVYNATRTCKDMCESGVRENLSNSCKNFNKELCESFFIPPHDYGCYINDEYSSSCDENSDKK